jgi:hypothetical protein
MARQRRGLITTGVGWTLGAVAGGFAGYFWMVEFNLDLRAALGCGPEDFFAYCNSWEHAVIRVTSWGGFLGSMIGGVLGLKARGYGHLVHTALALFVFIGVATLVWGRLVNRSRDGLEVLLGLLLPLVAVAARAFVVAVETTGARSSRSP